MTLFSKFILIPYEEPISTICSEALNVNHLLMKKKMDFRSMNFLYIDVLLMDNRILDEFVLNADVLQLCNIKITNCTGNC